MRRFGLALITLAGLVAGCGGSSSGTSSGGSTQSQATTSSQAGGGNQQASAQGKQVFTQNCAGCHTLAAAQANGQVGPNLDQLKPDRATVRRQVITGGKPGGMPPFKGRLTNAQINAVAQYVSSSAGQ
jgi:mono/diheme cytochrome c family protein